MADDPNRDILPCKDTTDRFKVTEKIDYHIISKLNRGEIEDKYLRLYDENTEMKKQIHRQDEKIKRLGTKLLRLINERKGAANMKGRKHFDESGTVEELQMRVVELEHENYSLKDKNVVLKQQLASHARHHAVVHRSPIHTAMNSPLISQRQPSATNINQAPYPMSGRDYPENQLREAETHIGELNEEIKSLHNKISLLQRDLEKNCLENQKSKVAENIELIRLQRAVKQQAVQVAALQMQIKKSEGSQHQLMQDLDKANQENDSATQIISEKQREILELYTKLEEKNLSRLEQEEMKHRIKNLQFERDSLKERSDVLLSAISSKSSDQDTVAELKRKLESERVRRKELQETLANMQKVLQDIHTKGSSHRLMTHGSGTSLIDNTTQTQSSPPTSGRDLNSHRNPQDELDLLLSTQLTRLDGSALNLSSAGPITDDTDGVYSTNVMRVLTNTGKKSAVENKLSADNAMPREQIAHTSPTDVTDVSKTTDEALADQYSRGSPGVDNALDIRERSHAATKLKMERELDYMRQMLRTQTQRCEALQLEIERLTFQLGVSNDKYADAVKRLDLQMKIFEHFDTSRSRESNAVVEDTGSQVAGETLVVAQVETEAAAPLPAEDRENLLKEEPPVPSESQIPTDIDGTNLAQDKRQQLPSIQRRRSTSVSCNKSNGGEDGQNSTHSGDKKRFVEEVYIDSSDGSSDSVITDGHIHLHREGHSLDSSAGVSDNSAGLSQGRRKRASRVSSTLSNFPSSETIARKEQEARNRREQREKFRRRVVSLPFSKPEKRVSLKQRNKLEVVSVTIEWLQLTEHTSLWDDADVNFLFVDFSFLDVKGQNTETPESVPKPTNPQQKGIFNYTLNIEMTPSRLQFLQENSHNRDLELFVFQLVSDPEDLPQDVDCTEVGWAILTLDQLVLSQSNESVLLSLTNDEGENLGTLSVRLVLPDQLKTALMH